MTTGTAFGSSAVVGRSDILGTCRSVVDRMTAGEGGLLLLAGEPGIGKTTIAQATASYAQSRGCTVRWSACPEDDAVPAFWPFVRLLSDPVDPVLRAAADELTGTDVTAGEPRFLLFDRIASALAAAAAARPQMLILDDLHWADPSTLRLLAFAVKQLRAARVLILGTYRDTDVAGDHPLLDLLAEPGTSGQTLTLEGLAVDDVTALLTGARGDAAPPPGTAARIREHTGGNPFFILHVARLLDAEGHLAAPERVLPLPVGVRAVLERRLARLSQPCAELLGNAGIIGMAFDAALLARVGGHDEATVHDLLAEADAARLIHRSPGGLYAFAHALVRATVLAQLPAHRRADLHAAVADALVAEAGDGRAVLAAVAHHELNAGGDRAATRGVAAAERAGQSAVKARAFEQAAELFSRAIDACRDPERVAVLYLALGDARLRAGDWDRAAQAFETAAGQARELNRGDLFASAVLGIGADTGGFEVRLGDHRQLERLSEALTLLGPSDAALRARLLARRSVAATNIAPPTEREAWSKEAVVLARQAGDSRTLTYALSSWCDAKAGPAFVDERLSAAEEMLAVAQTTDDREAALMARRFRVVALLELGDPEVHAEIDRFAAVAEALGQPLYRWFVPLFRGMQALLRGDLAAADRFCEEAAALGRDAGSDNAVMLSGTQAAGIAFERGQVAELVQEFERALEEIPWMRDLPIAIAMGPLIEVGSGRTEAATAKLHRLAADGFAVVPDDSEHLSTLSGISLAILLLEDHASAAAMYDKLLPHSGRMVVDGIAASCLDPVDYLLGRMALVLDRPNEAARHLRAAIEQTQRLGAPLLEAHAEHALARALETVDDDEAAALLERSEAALRAVGATPLLIYGLGSPAAASPEQSGRRRGVFQPDGGSWSLAFDGTQARVADAKGLHDLRHLLANPGTPVPAVALRDGDAGQGAAPAGRGSAVLDDQARAAYRARLRDLDTDIADAEAAGDIGRTEHAVAERDFLLDELAAAVGLGGRSRRMGDDTDRARKAVTMRIRNAIRRIGRAHPSLGRHLELTISTGSVCIYEPEEPVEWTV